MGGVVECVDLYPVHALGSPMSGMPSHGYEQSYINGVSHLLKDYSINRFPCPQRDFRNRRASESLPGPANRVHRYR